MKLSTVIKQARSSELDSVSQNKKTDEKIVEYINLGLLDLYGRFTLRSKEILITLQATKTDYLLDGTDLDVEVDGNPIDPDDILAIVGAFDENGEIFINNRMNDASIYTASYDALQIPATAAGAFISVIYKPVPTEVTFVDAGGGAAEEANVPLPMGLLQPLLKFIAYRAHSTLDITPEVQADPRYQIYLGKCAEAEAFGVVATESYNRPVNIKGFL